MENTQWDILCKELKHYGIVYVDDTCVKDLELKKKISFKSKLSQLKSEIKSLDAEFWDIWENMESILENNLNSVANPNKTDLIRNRLFIMSLNGLMNFSNCFYIECPILKSYSLKDINAITSEVISSIPEFLIAIDVLHREISKAVYLYRLVRCASYGEEKVNNLNTKIAAGVQGPWSNLDLPSKERYFEWDDIEEEIRGLSSDKKKQYRYRKGLENYNNDGRVGEGHYWREIRNEPYKFEDSSFDSPYPTRKSLSHW